MATLPWTAPREPAPGSDAVVLGSYLELRSFRDVPGFLLAALRVRRQVLRSPGALGVSLIAHPTRKVFRTLSAWADQGALDDFVQQEPHRSVMARYHERLADAAFTTWTHRVSDLPRPRSNAQELWRAAEHRLEGARAGA